MTKTVPEDKARQGRWGRQVLVVLIAALVLAMIAWGAAEFYGEAIDSGTPAGDSNAPAGQGQTPNG